jgi:hypothetical protein
MTDTLRCRHCGEPIGVYETLVVFAGGRPHIGSRLTLPPGEHRDAYYYHRSCFIERHGESQIGIGE